MPSAEGDAGYGGELGAVLVRNGVPIGSYDLEQPYEWWKISSNPVARMIRALARYQRPSA